MAHESHPAAREIIIDCIDIRRPDYIEADSQPLLDETGNRIKDENNNDLSGEPAH